MDAAMAAPVSATTSAGQKTVAVGSSCTSGSTSCSSQVSSRDPDTLQSTVGKAVGASSQVENASKKLNGKDDDDDVSKCPVQCAVPCCTRTGERLHQTTFFPCPLEPHPSSRLWAKAIGVKVILKNMYICEDHFQLEDDLENYLKFKYYPRGQQRFPRFKKGVVPWKFSKCRGTSPTVHHHRVPFSKTEFYKRQRARINRARGILSAKENNISPKESESVSKYDYTSQPSKLDAVKCKTELVQTTKMNANLENEQNVGDKRNKGSAAKKRISEGRKSSTSSEKGSYFNLLNGDLSTLIAHVQPAICSWDVSEVKLDQSESPKQADSTNGREKSNLGIEDSQSRDLKDAQMSGKVVDRKSSSISSKTSTSASSSSKARNRKKSASGISDASIRPQKSESESSKKSYEDSEDEIYMTPSEDEMNGYRDTSDTDFTISSDESWGEHEIVKPTRRSARNRHQKIKRTDRYSPPITLRSRAKKRSDVSVTTTLEPTRTSPKPKETCLNPDVTPKSQNSDSGLAGIGQEKGTSKLATPSQGEKDERSNGDTSEHVEAVDSRLNNTEMAKSPAKVNKLSVSPKKQEKNHVEHFLGNNVDKVIQAVSSVTSESESIINTLEDNRERSESKFPRKAPSEIEGKTNAGENPKWRLRETKSPLKGARLSVDMTDTVAKVFCPESQTSYSYKKVNVENKSVMSALKNRRRKQDNFLLVKDGDQVMATSDPLPPQICGLITNMRNSFDSFFDHLDELKTIVRDYHSENTVDSCLAEPAINKFLNQLRKYPDLMELEMAQFAIKCEKFHSEEMEKSFKNFKKIRWCNTNNCQNAARFHCCFSAAYCSRLCQTKDWGRHNRQCGQSRMFLDDPDLKLNPYMANRLRSIGNSKPTIGTCMSNLVELSSNRKPTNGKIILGSTNQSKCAKRPPASRLHDTSNPKVMRTTANIRSYLPASKVANAPPNAENNRLLNISSGAEGSATVKAEPPDVDMEVETGSPPPRPKLVMGFSLADNKSPTKTGATSQQVRITIPPNLLASLPSNVRPGVNAIPVANRIGQSNTTTMNSAPKITSVAVVPRSTTGSNSLVLPNNTSTGSVSSAPVTLRCKTVILPTGETQYIPVDGQTWSFKPNAQFVVKQINPTGAPITLLKQATTSGSILITRPAKPAYSKFIPISPAPTQAITSSIMSPEVTTMEPPDQPPLLTARLPKLTPVTPKAEPPAVRTLDSTELDKILSTDHLKEAFDMSYASNILRP